MDERKLSAVLADFARTMLVDFDIQRILDHLVERIVDVLPVTGAGVTLIGSDRRPHHVSASDPASLRWEMLQTELGEGPCVTSYALGEAVAVPDLLVDTAYPNFRPPALAVGLAAVFTFPLRGEGGSLGALDLYRDVPGPLDPKALDAAQTLADVAAAYLRNASARHAAERAAEEHRVRSLHDPLTGLPNGRLLRQRLEHAAARAHRTHSSCAVLFVDLDRFKRVNDVHGHDIGDRLLVAVAHRLSAHLRPGDTLARLHGDEFVVLCEDLVDPADAELLAARLTQAFSAPFCVPGEQVMISASVGIAYAGPGEVVTPQLLVDADAAMYEAKRGGGGTHRLVDLRTAHLARDQDGLVLDLRCALEDDSTARGLAMAYQPVVRLSDGVVVGAEALLRWTHPVRGPLPPPAVVDVAEGNGMSSALGTWVLRHACLDWARWSIIGGQRMSLAVNVTARQVMRRDFPALVATVLAETGMDPGCLVLEVTEGIFIDDGERAAAVIAEVRATGVRVALDDFGTGYSSLGYLRRFPVDIIKMDRSFVAQIGEEPTADAVATAITDLSHVLSMTVTAEGVETDLQRRQLLTMGCENAQGYLFARPMPSEELCTRLTTADGPARLP